MAPSGAEVILGVKNDRQLGPLLLVGLGGVFVEVFRDTALIPCPISLEEAHETATAVENKLKRQFGKGTLVSIHVEPVKKSNEATE